MLCLVSDSPIQERYWPAQGVQQRTIQDGQEARALALWAEATGLGLVQPGKETELGRALKGSLLLPMGRFQRRWSQALRSGAWQVVRDNRHKCKWKSFRPDIKENFFTAKTVKWCQRLYREVVASPSLEVFQDLTGKIPEKPGSWPCLHRRLDWRPPKVPCSLSHPMILWSNICYKQKYTALNFLVTFKYRVTG